MTLYSDVEGIYPILEGSHAVMEYGARHGVKSAAILTIFEPERAEQVAAWLCPRIHGKTVVEIGAGIGLLAMALAVDCAARVYAIEAQPSWTWVYVQHLHAKKPKNLTFIFAAADEMAGQIRADVALFLTQSDREGMRRAGLLFAPEVIDVWAELEAPAKEKGQR